MSYQLIHGDCLDADWPQVDAIITDVPYGTTACKWDVIIPFDKMWTKIKGSLKPRGAFVTTASQPFTSALVMSNPKWFNCEWIWNKSKAANFPQVKHKPLKTHENIIVFSNGKVKYIPQKETRGKERTKGGYFVSGEVAVMDGAPKTFNNSYYPKTNIDISIANNKDAGIHPTQKPVALYEYLIKTYTNEGDTVLDFCFGSCTTGVACINTGRNFIGIEKELKYFEIGQERMRLAQK